MCPSPDSEDQTAGVDISGSTGPIDGDIVGRDKITLIVQLIKDPIFQNPTLFVLGALGSLLIALMVVQVRSADLLDGLLSAATSYLVTVITLITEPSRFLKTILDRTAEGAHRAAVSGMGFWLLNYLGGVLLVYALRTHREAAWLCKWLFAGSLFGLASICASGVIASWSMQTIGYTAKTEQITALEGYQAGIAVVIFAVGTLTMLGIIKSRQPAIFEGFRESNFRSIAKLSKYDPITHVLVGATGLATYAAVGFYGVICLDALGPQSFPYFLANVIFLLILYFIRKLIVDE
jgi:hypothetical protein